MITFASIPGHPGFTARNDGVIIGKRGVPMVGSTDRCGYHWVVFSENGRTKSYMVHRLIAQTFIPNPENLPCINHKDGNKQNNAVDNLEWCTKSENTKHSYRVGLQRIVTNQHGTYKVLDDKDFNIIRDMHHRGVLDREIAKEIGCSRSAVSKKIREWGIRNDHD